MFSDRENTITQLSYMKKLRIEFSILSDISTLLNILEENSKAITFTTACEQKLISLVTNVVIVF